MAPFVVNPDAVHEFKTVKALEACGIKVAPTPAEMGKTLQSVFKG